MKLSKKFTTVTPFSKYLALALFILLPVVAFLWGFSCGFSDGMLRASIKNTALPVMTFTH